MRLRFYGYEMEYDGRELGICTGSDIFAPYHTMNVRELEREAGRRPKDDFLKYINNWHILSGKQLEPNIVRLPENKMKAIEAMRDFCKELLDALAGK